MDIIFHYYFPSTVLYELSPRKSDFFWVYKLRFKYTFDRNLIGVIKDGGFLIHVK